MEPVIYTSYGIGGKKRGEERVGGREREEGKARERERANINIAGRRIYSLLAQSSLTLYPGDFVMTLATL